MAYISIGDFIDLFYKLKQKGCNELLQKLHLSGKDRTISKWDKVTSSSDFWLIPVIRKRWNKMCTGDPEMEYEDYIVSNYLSNAKDLRMLSVGCGTGSRERKFARYGHFGLIEGIDIAPGQVEEARYLSSKLNLKNLKYITSDFKKTDLKPDHYDIVLFNSSLHHFDDIHNLLYKKVLPILKKNGLLVIFEYVGPDRLQCTNYQLEFANNLLKELPRKYKIRFKSKSVKNRIYRPGLLRMLLVDPSEAVDSASILPSVHKYFKIVEEKKLGWDITYLLFKDISHNFLNDNEETRLLLSYIFSQEDRYMSITGRSDGIFGIYQKADLT